MAVVDPGLRRKVSEFIAKLDDYGVEEPPACIPRSTPPGGAGVADSLKSLRKTLSDLAQRISTPLGNFDTSSARRTLRRLDLCLEVRAAEWVDGALSTESMSKRLKALAVEASRILASVKAAAGEEDDTGTTSALPERVSEEEYLREAREYSAKIPSSYGPLIYNTLIFYFDGKKADDEFDAQWMKRLTYSKIVWLDMGKGYRGVMLAGLPQVVALIRRLCSSHPLPDLLEANHGVLPEDHVFISKVRGWFPVEIENDLFFRIGTVADNITEYDVVYTDYGSHETKAHSDATEVISFKAAVRYHVTAPTTDHPQERSKAKEEAPSPEPAKTAPPIHPSRRSSPPPSSPPPTRPASSYPPPSKPSPEPEKPKKNRNERKIDASMSAQWQKWSSVGQKDENAQERRKPQPKPAQDDFQREHEQSLSRLSGGKRQRLSLDNQEGQPDAKKAKDIGKADAKRRLKEAAKGLPPGWTPYLDPKGNLYYGHKATGKSSWVRPTA